MGKEPKGNGIPALQSAHGKPGAPLRNPELDLGLSAFFAHYSGVCPFERDGFSQPATNIVEAPHFKCGIDAG